MVLELGDVARLVASGDVKSKPGDTAPEPATARDILDQLADGTLTYEEALPKIRALPRMV